MEKPLGKGIVFVDFGRGKVYAVVDGSEAVMVFGGFMEMLERLQPTTVVADSYPRRLQNVITQANDVTFLRLRDLRKIAEERRKNNFKKSDTNDVMILRQLFHQRPNCFQSLHTAPEELTIRALTELWVQMSSLRKSSKQAKTVTNHEIAVEIHRMFQKILKRLAVEIHTKALKLPLYRRIFEELGLKGPALAYIISHDHYSFATLSRTALEVRYGMFRRPWKARPLRSQLLVLLTSAAIMNKHPRYLAIYEHYRKGKGKGHWPATLRVAQRVLRDIQRLAQKAGAPTSQGKTQKAGEANNLYPTTP